MPYLPGTGFASADLSQADWRNTDLDQAALIMARTTGLLTGALPDQSVRTELPPDTDPRSPQQRIDDHVRRVKTDGREGQPARLDGLDLRAVEGLAGSPLTALQAVQANLSGLDLRGAELQGARLSGADLRRCDLGGADLRGADLSGANLSHAKLAGARLDPLNLRGTRLSDARTEGADFQHARRDPN